MVYEQFVYVDADGIEFQLHHQSVGQERWEHRGRTRQFIGHARDELCHYVCGPGESGANGERWP